MIMDGVRLRTLSYNINLASHYEHITEKSSSHRAAAGGRRAGVVGGNPARRLRCRDATTTRLCAAAACLRGAPTPGIRRAGGRRRAARDRSSASLTGLRAAALSRRWVSVDPGLLGLGRRRILLGARNLGAAAASRSAMDPGLLGLRRRRLCI